MEHEQARKLAELIVADLFVTGFGEKADRLALMTSEGRKLGGWGREPAAARIAAILEHAQ